LLTELLQLLPLTRPLIALDVETFSKLPPEENHICEIGFRMIYPDGREPKRWVSFVKPPLEIHEEATAVHHITNEMVKDAPSWKEVGPNIAKGFTDCDYAGYNVRFDLRVIAGEMARIGVPWSYSNAFLLDGLRLWQVSASRTLTDALREFCGREPTGAHRALEDAEDALDVIIGQLKRFDKLPRDLKQLHDLCFKDNGKVDPDGKFIWKGKDVAITFGKHSGKRLQDIPRAYLEWMCGQSFSNEVKTLLGTFLESGKLPLGD